VPPSAGRPGPISAPADVPNSLLQPQQAASHAVAAAEAVSDRSSPLPEGSVERLTPVHPRLAGTVGRGVRKSDEPLGRACAE
jgi:hypothetical protein